MFDYVRLLMCSISERSIGKILRIVLPNPIEVNRTIVVRLSSITERLIDYAEISLNFVIEGPGIDDRLKELFVTQIKLIAGKQW